MSRTLYDILEVSENASQEVIHAAYSRLSEKLKSKIANEHAPDAEILLRALTDAFRTLSSPQSRNRYDASLAAKIAVYEDDEPFWTKTKIALMSVIMIVAFGAYAKHSREVEREQTERARIVAEQAEKDRLAKLEAEHAQLARDKEIQDRRDAAQLQQQFERDRRYAESISSRNTQQLTYDQQRAERDQRSAQRTADYDRQRQEQEARRQAEGDKRRLRELEYENRTNRPSVVAVPRK